MRLIRSYRGRRDLEFAFTDPRDGNTRTNNLLNCWKPKSRNRYGNQQLSYIIGRHRKFNDYRKGGTYDCW